MEISAGVDKYIMSQSVARPIFTRQRHTQASVVAKFYMMATFASSSSSIICKKELAMRKIGQQQHKGKKL